MIGSRRGFSKTARSLGTWDRLAEICGQFLGRVKLDRTMIRIDSVARRVHPAAMGDLMKLPTPRSRWFADSRGRSLKATWHAEAEVVVMSLWESDRCVGTFQLPVADAPQLMVLLAEAVKAWAAQPLRVDLELDAGNEPPADPAGVIRATGRA